MVRPPLFPLQLPVGLEQIWERCHEQGMERPKERPGRFGVSGERRAGRHALQIFFAPLNDARDQVVRDVKGEPVVWAVEMSAASVAARQGVTVNNFPRGTIISVGLHPHRNGFPAGGRGESGLFKCPADTPPAPGRHCDSVKGTTSHGPGVLPKPTGPVPTPSSR